MNDNRNRKIVPSSGGGMLSGVTQRLKLIARLLADPRVSPLAKLLPIGTFVYLIVPDLIPTPIDDAMLIWLGSYLFVELCPPAVVEEHMKALESTAGNPASPQGEEEEIIDGEYWERK